MLRIALIYGGASGALILFAMVGVNLASGGTGAPMSQAAGYLIMLVALSSIFLGVKRYRDIDRGGVIKFLPAFGLGLAIAAIAGAAYVIAWEAYLAMTNHAFINVYTDAQIAQQREAGVSGDELDAFVARMDALRAQYANPLYRLPMTFTEIFPVGLLVALISAVLLRNPRVLPRQA